MTTKNPSNSESITTLIVGAGAVENAWSPIVKALNNFHHVPMTADGSNAFLARLIYLLRWYSASETPEGKQAYKETLAMLTKIRSSICRELRKAEEKGQIRVRPEFEEVIKSRILPYSSKILLVTTNWDNVVGRYLSKILNTKVVKFEVRPQFIHGSYNTPNLLYLPTEMTKEPYRTKGEEMRIGKTHGAIWRAMEKTNRSVVYGLSISPLDAELSQILACGWSSPLMRELEIITPDHALVAHRAKLLLDPRYNNNIIVRGYSPFLLDSPIDYSST